MIERFCEDFIASLLGFAGDQSSHERHAVTADATGFNWTENDLLKIQEAIQKALSDSQQS